MGFVFLVNKVTVSIYVVMMLSKFWVKPQLGVIKVFSVYLSFFFPISPWIAMNEICMYFN